MPPLQSLRGTPDEYLGHQNGDQALELQTLCLASMAETEIKHRTVNDCICNRYPIGAKFVLLTRDCLTESFLYLVPVTKQVEHGKRLLDLPDPIRD